MNKEIEKALDNLEAKCLKAEYFDIICKFGLLTNNGLSPVESSDHPFRIALHGRQNEIGWRTTCYGKTVEEVCALAFATLKQYAVIYEEKN